MTPPPSLIRDILKKQFGQLTKVDSTSDGTA